MKEQKKGLSTASESLTLALQDLKEVSVTREVVQSKTNNWQLTGVDRVKVNAGEVSAVNEGLVTANCYLCGLQLNASSEQGRKWHVDTTVSRGHVEVTPPKDGLPAKQLVIHGRARASFDSLAADARSSDDGDIKAGVEVKRLDVDTPEETTISVDKDRIKIPQGLKLTAQGQLLELADSKLRINPAVQASGSTDVTLTSKGKQISLPVNIAKAAERLNVEIPINTSSDAGLSTPDIFVTDGDLDLNDLQVGPVRINHVKANMGSGHNGNLNLDAELDLQDLIVKASEADRSIPWYIRPLLKNKTARVLVETGIERGRCQLDGLRSATLTFEAHENAGLFDRLATRALNFCSRWILGLLRKFKTGLHDVKEKQQDGIECLVKRPFIQLQFGPFRKTITLPFSEHCLRVSDNTLDLPFIFHETVGVTALTSELLAKTSLDLRELASDEKEVCLRALDRLHALMTDTTAESGLILLLANRWPLSSIKSLVTQGLESEKHIWKLANIADVFARHPSTQVTALLLADLLKPTRGNYIQRMIDDPEVAIKSDVTLKGLLYEQRGDSGKAKQCYLKAMETAPKNPLTNVRMAQLLLQEIEQFKTKTSGVGQQMAFESMNYLLTAVEQGDETAVERLNAAMESKAPIISETAKLYRAAVIFKTEKTYDDFSRALALLESIPGESAVHKLVVDLLAQRIQNGRHTFHTENISEMDKTDEQIKKYLKRVEKKKDLPEGQKAYDLGLKLLYSARGAAFRDENLHRADLLLSRALKAKPDTDYQQSVLLHREVVLKELQNRKKPS